MLKGQGWLDNTPIRGGCASNEQVVMNWKGHYEVVSPPRKGLDLKVENPNPNPNPNPGDKEGNGTQVGAKVKNGNGTPVGAGDENGNGTPVGAGDENGNGTPVRSRGRKRTTAHQL